MKHKSSFLFLPLLAVLALAQPAFGQRDRDRDRDRDDDDRDRYSSAFASRLWYGGGLNLGFGAAQGQSRFLVGVSPMVGYKILPWLSLGPRFGFNFTSFKVTGYRAANLFDVEAGGFLRLKVFRGLFLQGELSNEWLQVPTYPTDPGSTRLDKISYQRSNQRIGAGWNSSAGRGGWGTDIGIFYNFARQNDLLSDVSPLEYRFGITYNF